MDNSMGIDCGRRGRGEQQGEIGTTVIEQQQIK